MESGLLTREAAQLRATIDISLEVEQDLAEILTGVSLQRSSVGFAHASTAYVAAKRTFDVVAAALAIVLASPLMAIIALAVRLESRGPAFFGHVRLGRDGKLFRCLKFRSMRVEAQDKLEEDDELWRCYVENDYKIPVDLDPRVTRMGRFLRKSSLDELPQLFNVLAGSMSLVGPRPIVEDEIRWYDDRAKQFLSVKPGITGAWQVQGRSRIGYPDRTEVELDAIRNRTFSSDLKILLRSIPAVITARGSL
jgi:lipopolysaccharide/colanic/teichoic acid biosynthesis glycosyltransferase